MSDPIKKQTSCMDDYDPGSLAADVALKKILDSISPIQLSETVEIRHALGRVLANDITSSINVPSGTNSAMDGYAISSSDIPNNGTCELNIVGTSFAGQSYDGKLSSGECVRIMTGAIMPDGSDTVVIQEYVEKNDDQIRIGPDTKSGANVRQAGEDISKGDTVLKSGSRLTPADIGLIASLGIGKIAVTKQLRVAFFSTGDELCSIGDEPEEGKIYDSNRYTLFGMLSRLGVDIIDMGVIRDIREDVESAFNEAANAADVLITTGGVSVGEADYIKEILEKVGTVNFWKVAIKPGRPLAFGNINDTLFFGLPGNPVSVMVTFYQFVQPALRYLMGEQEIKSITVKAICKSKLKKRPGRVEYQRGILEQDESGQLIVRKTGMQGSGILRSMSQANCFIILPMESSEIEPNNLVDVQPFYGLI
jgi:molybdopterin molybdotransferase